jgi:hypothetical protein
MNSFSMVTASEMMPATRSRLSWLFSSLLILIREGGKECQCYALVPRENVKCTRPYKHTHGMQNHTSTFTVSNSRVEEAGEVGVQAFVT